MSSKKIEKNTQQLFSKIHPKQLKDRKIFEKIEYLIESFFFGVKKNF